MIAVDSSALIAILDAEEDAARYAQCIADHDVALVSAATLLEVGIVMVNRHGKNARRRVDALVQTANLQIESFTPEHARLALDGFAKYGKGQKHSAGLNYGDCFSYALCKATGLPLLFKGNDFTKTDLDSAL